MSKKALLVAAAAGAAALAVVGCATMPSPQELDAQADAMIRSSFREEGIAKLDRLQQDAAQDACSSPQEPSAAVAKKIQDEALASIRWPTGGQYLGDWKKGEKLAQSGRGMTWNDPSPGTDTNGGNCYNCHEIDRHELSFGTIGPSLWNYGKLRGVKDPVDPKSAAVVQYTWAKIWNSKSTVACSLMPRFGQHHLLDENQIRDIMALLLDPKSPVNQ
jgi:sulfur-oxidizing protein SoxX